MFPYTFSAATTFNRPPFEVEVEPQPASRSRERTITVLITILARIVNVSATRQDLSELLERHDVRATPRRLEVLEELAQERDDVTAQQLWSRLRDRDSRAGLATVYRTLALLSEKGVVDVLSHRGGEQCYRLCGDAHHHHLLCERCHRVVEIQECGLNDWVTTAAKQHGFVATDHSVEIVGLCADCR
jgi:Fur family transcriptional regulator, ferric uptake regulator